MLRVRASDDMRRRVAATLDRRHAEGFLSAETFAERLVAVHASRTVAELDEALADLPAAERPWAPLARRLGEAAQTVRRAAARRPPPAHLDLHLGALDRRPLVLGRAATCAIRLADPSVSRRHAELRPLGTGRWIVQDLGSTNGTLLNGRPVLEAPVAPGDELLLGDLRTRLL
jgi:hypothetical protein